MWSLNAISLCETHLHSACRFNVLMRIEPMNNRSEIAGECSIDIIVHRHKGLRHRHTYKTALAYKPNLKNECFAATIARYAGPI